MESRSDFVAGRKAQEDDIGLIESREVIIEHDGAVLRGVPVGRCSCPVPHKHVAVITAIIFCAEIAGHWISHGTKAKESKLLGLGDRSGGKELTKHLALLQLDLGVEHGVVLDYKPVAVCEAVMTKATIYILHVKK